MDVSRNTIADASRSLAGYASTSNLSTREPLRPPHPLLNAFNLLLVTLGIPLSLNSLSLATPTLLLTTFEALLETRLIDVPEEYRGSWERGKRTRVTQVLVSAIGEVCDALERRGGGGKGENGKAWRREEVEIRGVVRGNQGELGKLVDGLLRIAKGLQVPFDESTLWEEGTARRRRNDTTGMLEGSGNTPIKLEPLCAKPSSSTPRSLPPFHQPFAPTPTILFTPRPLRRNLNPIHTPDRPAPSLSSSTATTSSSRSSARTARTHSTSLTIPRPSLLDALERTISPPPRMPGSPRRTRLQNQYEDEEKGSERQGGTGTGGKRSTLRSERQGGTGTGGKRSTLRLMREFEENKTKEKTSGEEKEEIEDVFSTPSTRNNRPIQEEIIQASTLRLIQVGSKDRQEASTRSKATEDDKGKSALRERREGSISKKRGKERAREREAARLDYDSNSGQECCAECRVAAVLPRKKGKERSEGEGADVKESREPREDGSSRIQNEERRRRVKVRDETRDTDWCECCSDEGGEADVGSSTSVSGKEEVDQSSSRSTIRKDISLRPRTAPDEASARRRRRAKDSGEDETGPKDSGQPLQSSPTSPPAPPARRVRVERTKKPADPTSSKELGNLSVHGESEIERFERNRLPLPTSSGGPPTTLPSTAPAQTEPATLSPYTMLLLAQRANLAEKLRALELRERDRVRARERGAGISQEG
ncbi:hypothetical protein JCM16303_005513 [Sporobolomyces ruberrimus]